MSLQRNQLNEWLKTIKVDCEKVGDVGVADNPNNEKVGSFNCKEYVKFDVIENSYADEILDLNEPYNKFQNYFDVIFCTEVFEHLTNPLQATKNIYRMLKKNGIFYLSVVFIYPHHGKLDMLRFTDYGLKKILSRVKFGEIEITERVATAGLGSLVKFYKEEGMHSPELRGDYTYPIGYCIKCKKI